ncbi:MAG: phosphatase PAP2 family protein, partial [Eubacterium sp.]|nr:phosphatase PAP2 family protein [Eubacterium sp.]
DQLTRFLYSIDEAANLFPSIHCLVSWLCFIGIRSAKNVSLFAKLFSLISAILIMISTQVLKQHYIVDMISGIALAEICYFISGHIRLKDIVFNWYKKLVLKRFPKCEFK